MPTSVSKPTTLRNCTKRFCYLEEGKCGGLQSSQCFKSFSRSVIVVVPYIRTPLATTWFGSKPSLNRKVARRKDLSWVVPICSVFFRSAFLVFWNTPICSDLLRFVSRTTNQSKSGKPPSADPIGESPTQRLIFTYLSFHGCTRLLFLLFLCYRACV